MYQPEWGARRGDLLPQGVSQGLAVQVEPAGDLGNRHVLLQPQTADLLRGEGGEFSITVDGDFCITVETFDPVVPKGCSVVPFCRLSPLLLSLSSSSGTG